MLVLVQLTCMTLAVGAGAQQHAAKEREGVRVTADQMHQLEVAKVETFAFTVQKSAIGQIAFNEDTGTTVLTPFSGRVTRVLANIGDTVKRGQPLLELDSPEVLQPQNDFIAAIAALNKARSQLGLAQTVEQRQRTLYESKASALKDLQQAEAQLAAAQSDIRSAETAVEAARTRLRIIGRTDADIGALQEKGAISRTIAIDAPIDGTIIARKVGPGQQLRSDVNDPLYTIANLSSMWLKAFVPEADIASIKVGQEIEVRIGALPDRVFKAQITAIGSASDTQTRRVVVRSEVPNPDGALKADMFANFKIRAGTETSPAVPVNAIIREGETAVVWIEKAGDDMLFLRRPVMIGMEQNGLIQVRDGLKPGERVLSRGAIFVDNEARQ